MLTQLNKTCVRLWKDESGVVLALTVVVFLTLFVLACSVYAVGENIRQRIELQNAADAAVYSAAIVQADAISRIAAINRAMGWTYIQSGRMTMDYIVDKWLERVVQIWSEDRDMVTKKASQSDCVDGLNTGWNDWYVGKNYGDDSVYLNHRQWKSIGDVEAKRSQADAAGKSYSTLGPKIDIASQAITAMGLAEVNIIDNLRGRMKSTAEEVLKKNVASLGGDVHFAFLNHEATECFEVVKKEESFLRMLFGNPTQATETRVFGPEGTDAWFKNTGGIQRYYLQTSQSLEATWNWHYGVWKERSHSSGTPPVSYTSCDRIDEKTRSRKRNGTGNERSVLGQDVADKYFTTTVAEPQWLRKEYFGEPGAIVVAVARCLQNPFLNTFGDLGIFSSFNPTTSLNGNQFMWGLAAAKAGYRDNGRGGDGAYNPTCDSHDDTRDHDVLVNPGFHWKVNTGWKYTAHNLTFSDWDTVLLPVRRAWSSREPAWQDRSNGHAMGPFSVGQWEDPNAGTTLLNNLLTLTQWEPLWGGNALLPGLQDGLQEVGMALDVYH